MPTRIGDLSIEEFRSLVSETVRNSVEDAVEDFIALQSSGYVQSIAQAREDRLQGRVKHLEDCLDG